MDEDKRSLTSSTSDHSIEHAEANERFESANADPLLASREKKIPLYIKNLVFTESSVIFNHTVYRIGLTRFPTNNGILLAPFLRDNANGGVKYDLDEFGGRDMGADDIRMPGDIHIAYVVEEAVLGKEEVSKKMQEDEKQLKAMRLIYGESPSDDLKFQIEEIEARILPWKCRKENKAPPFETAVRVSIREANGEEVVLEKERFQKLYQAKKCYLNQLLGDRPTITVEKLDVSKAAGVLRLPVGFKVRINHLTISANVDSVLTSIQPIIDPQSFPLAKLTVLIGPVFKDSVNHEHDLLRSAKSVTLVNSNHPIDSENWLPVILKMQNRFVEVKGVVLSALQLLSIIDKWVEDGGVGRVGNMSVHGKEVATELFGILRNRSNVEIHTLGQRPFPEQFRLPIDHSSSLYVECDYQMGSRETSRLCLKLKIQ